MKNTNQLMTESLEAPNLEQTESIEVVLFDYEDDEYAFTLSFEFVYTYNHQLQKGFAEIR